MTRSEYVRSVVRLAHDSDDIVDLAHRLATASVRTR